MTIHLDHTIVPSRDKAGAARQLAELLAVPRGRAAAGPFTAVYVNDSLTLDFIDTGEAFPVYHFCFRVDDAAFDAILARLDAAGIPWRGEVRGADDRKVGTYGGGRNVYWNQPDGHQWEILTRSYARQPR
ncbi:VOC family protein [Ramlibacter terrae]|uniref:VOC family protein n=1 Tax=Ramlibacter terrae TaxID=2732511 RepID=A0ABX6P6A5_9BURK|nr:VOC family protein [Ramlibacter terrae]